MALFAQGLVFEAAMPKGLPAGWHIAATALVASQLGDALEALLHRHASCCAPGLEGHELHHFSGHHFGGGSLGLLAGPGPQLQQPPPQWSQQPQQPPHPPAPPPLASPPPPPRLPPPMIAPPDP